MTILFLKTLIFAYKFVDRMHTLIEKKFLKLFSENDNFNLVHAVINCKSKSKTLKGMDFKKEGKIENIKKIHLHS